MSLGDIPFVARIGAFLLFAATMILIERVRNKGSVERQWEYGFLIVLVEYRGQPLN
jgi:hypothetical protein